MKEKSFINSAKVLIKGQVIVPKDVRLSLDVVDGDRLYFIVDGDSARIMNSKTFAKKMTELKIFGKDSSLNSESDTDRIIEELLNEAKNKDNAEE